MLPPILEVAEKLNIEFDERTLEKEEVRAKCPFCGGDNPTKFHLSINQKKNLFKCWYCSKSGGVLHLESLVSGKPFSEVREKYFGKRKKPKAVHPAHQLTPEQLEAIGWRSVKRKDFNSFNRSREQVLKDWEVYKYEELVKYYAVLLLIAHFPDSNKKRSLYSWFSSATKSSKVEDLKSLLVGEYKHPQHPIWARRGKDIARLAYLYSMTNDRNFENLFSNVLFVIEIMKIKKQKNQKVSI